MFILNGDVFSQLKAHKKKLRSSPKNIVKSWSKNTPHILAFVNALIRHKVYNRQKLLDVWQKDKFCKFALQVSYTLKWFKLKNNFYSLFSIRF